MGEMDGDQASQIPDLRHYWHTVWRRRFVIVVTVVLAVGAAVALSEIQTPVYEATADVVIQPSGSQQIIGSSAQNAQDAQRNVDTETAVLQSRAVKDAATQRLGHVPDVNVTNDSATSNVVSISARSTNKQRAAADANGYAATYLAYSRKQNLDDLLQAGQQIQVKLNGIEARLPSLPSGSPELTAALQQQAFLQQQLDQLQLSASLKQVGGARILAKANVPSTPVEPRPLRNAALGLVLGLLLGIGIAFLLELADDRIISREELERASDGLPVLGQIPHDGTWRDRRLPRLVTIEASNSSASEAYRSLRTSIQFLGVDREMRSVQFTSTKSEDGKTTTLANVAVAFARAGRRVTIVCCDLRRPRVHEFFGLPNEVGYTSLLLGDASAEESLQRVPEVPNLLVLSAGPEPPNPSELLSGGRAREVISSLEQTADLVLVDTPPILPVSDALIVSGWVDATIVVARAKVSSRRSMRRAIEILRQVDAPVVGTVLNGADAVERYADEYVGKSGKRSQERRLSRRQRREATRATG
jgi:capsular exopolysaccharide synthesis family protein